MSAGNPGALPITQANAATSSYEDAQLGQVPPSNDVKQLRRPDLLVNSIIAGGNSVSTGGTTAATLGAIGGFFGFKNCPKCTTTVTKALNVFTIADFPSRFAFYGGTGKEITTDDKTAAGGEVKITIANTLIGTVTAGDAPLVAFLPIQMQSGNGVWAFSQMTVSTGSIEVRIKFIANAAAGVSGPDNLIFALWLMDAKNSVV